MEVTLNNENVKFEITECICCWYDLLGFGKPLIDSNWNLENELSLNSLNRILNLQYAFPNSFSLARCKSLSLNDGAIINYDIMYKKQHLKREVIFVLDDLITDYLKIDYLDISNNNPGLRGIITYGHRYNYSDANTTIVLSTGNEVSYHPREFQMNTAFSKAYIMESSGSKMGLSGNDLYIDNYLLGQLNELLLNKTKDEVEYGIIKEISDKNELVFKIMENDTSMLELWFEKTPIEFIYKGINTQLFKFIRKNSYQDDKAFEAAYNRAVQLSFAQDEENTND